MEGAVSPTDRSLKFTERRGNRNGSAAPKRRLTLTTQSNEQARARAEASFKKEERAKEGAKAMTEYQANGRIVREKMERLRALRLGKAVADKKPAD
jgi:hypothetical protein